MRVCKAVGSVALSLVIVLSVLCVHGFKHLPRASKVTRTKQLSMVAELHEPLLTALTSAGHHHAALHDRCRSLAQLHASTICPILLDMILNDNFKSGQHFDQLRHAHDALPSSSSHSPQPCAPTKNPTNHLSLTLQLVACSWQ